MTAGCASFFGKIRICPGGGNAGIPEPSEKWYEIRQMLYNYRYGRELRQEACDVSRMNIPLTGESWLFVPAREKMIRSIRSKGEVAADVIIFDLEDSLGPDEKEEGLALLVRELAAPSAGTQEAQEQAPGPRIYIRINAADNAAGSAAEDAGESAGAAGGRMQRELEALKDCAFEGYVLPKCEDLTAADRYPELFEGKKIAALVETPRGILNLEKIAGDARVHALMLGGEDFCAELGVPSSPEALAFARSQIILFAAAYGKKSLDTVSFEYRDKDAFLKLYGASLQLGFSGRLMIHPAQAQAARERDAALLSEGDLVRFREIIRQYREGGGGALVIDGTVYERMHIERMERLERLYGKNTL